MIRKDQSLERVRGAYSHFDRSQSDDIAELENAKGMEGRETCKRWMGDRENGIIRESRYILYWTGVYCTWINAPQEEP